jgi:CSLREA domain-containing protein
VITPAAGTITVNSTADVANSTDGVCTLREAITAANTDTASGPTAGECTAGGGADTINFSVTGTIDLASALPDISSEMLLNGPGASLLTIQRSTTSGTPDFRIFNVTAASPGVVTFSGLTIAKGILFFGAAGAGILNNGTATINVTNSTLSNNTASGHGGGIFNNSAGTVNLTNSTLNNNTASSDGGGLNNFSNGTVHVTNSTFNTNDAGSNGGGISNSNAGTVNVTNSSFNNNSAFNGGGISNFRILNATNCTFTKNKAMNVGGGISSFGSSQARIRNSIIALNAPGSGRDVIGTFITQGHNLIGEIENQSTGFTVGTNNSNGDLVGTSASPINPMLASIANYGGPTQTLALLPGSPAIDAGDNCVTQAAHCGDANITQLSNDQRGAGFNRSVDGNGDGTATVDIGAFESRGGFTISATSGTPQSAAINTNFSAPLVATLRSAFGEPVAGGVVTFTAPASGPRGTFAGSNTATVTADANGVATSPTFTANSLAGNYNVVASAQGVPTAAA